MYWEWFYTFLYFPQRSAEFQPEFRLEYLKNSGIIPPTAFFVTLNFEKFLRHHLNNFFCRKKQMSAEFCSKKQQTMSSITDLTFIDQNNGKFKKYIFCRKSLKSLQGCGYACILQLIYYRWKKRWIKVSKYQKNFFLKRNIWQNSALAS